MSMTLTRTPLESIVMNAANGKRRSARLSAEGTEAEEAKVVKRSRTAAVGQTTSVATKEVDGDTNTVGGKRKRKDYNEKDDDFSFIRNKKSKPAKAPLVRTSTSENGSPAKAAPPLAKENESMPPPPRPVAAPAEEAAPKRARKKGLPRLPTTPEHDAPTKIVRRSKRLSDENEKVEQTSPHKPAHARSHAKHETFQESPFKPLTVKKKRQQEAEVVVNETRKPVLITMAETPAIRRNKEMRKSSADGLNRRSSSSMRGQRASSLIDEGRGNGEFTAIFERVFSCLPRGALRPAATDDSMGRKDRARVHSSTRSAFDRRDYLTPPPSEPSRPRTPRTIRFTHAVKNIFADTALLELALPHSEVPSSEFYKHISSELLEQRRMRCLLGWCGTRALPSKPEPPKESSAAANLDFQAMQAARVIQEELASDLVTNNSLSDWFSPRPDDVPPIVPLRKRPNPRNVANAAKAEELERELERLKKERAEWDQLITSSAAPVPSPTEDTAPADGQLSPINPDLLDSPQRAILEQLQAPSDEPEAIQSRLKTISTNLEFTIDQFAHGVHAIATTKATADRLAERSLAEAASVLEERERVKRVEGKAVAPMDALRGLARVMNRRGR